VGVLPLEQGKHMQEPTESEFKVSLSQAVMELPSADDLIEVKVEIPELIELIA